MAQSLEVVVEQVGATTSKATVRSHTVFVDRPTAKGGADRGPLGGEFLLIALGGCFMSNLLAAIRAREAAITDVRVTVNGTIGDTPERFMAIRLTIAATHDDPDLLQKVAAIAERACIVTNTLKTSAPIALVFPEPPPAASRA